MMNNYKSIIEKNSVSNIDYNYNILIVEDDDVSYLLLSEILSSYPLKITRAFDGEEAIMYFSENKSNFDLVLMDIKLPKINGYDATQAIKGKFPSIPIIACTAFSSKNDVVEVRIAIAIKHPLTPTGSLFLAICFIAL